MIRSFPLKTERHQMIQWTGTPESAQEITDFVETPDYHGRGFHAHGYAYEESPELARLWDARLQHWSLVPIGHWVVKDAKYGFHVLSPEELVSDYHLPPAGHRDRREVAKLRALVADFGDEHRCCPVEPILDEVNRLEKLLDTPAPSVGLPSQPVVLAVDPGVQVEQEPRLIGPAWAHRDAPCGPECYETKEV